MYCEGNPVNMVDPDGRRPKPREAALMAAYVYLDDDHSTYLEELITYGWQLSEYSSSITKKYTGIFQNGLQSALFERSNDGITEYAYVYAGTNSLEDWLENVAQMLGGAPQYQVAIHNARTLSKDLGNQELTFVGHSLGGGEAIAASMATGRPAITFNAASVSSLTKWANSLNEKYDVVNYRTVGGRIQNRRIRFGGDPLSNFLENLGIGAQGRTIPVYIGYNLSHKIKRFLQVKLPEP